MSSQRLVMIRKALLIGVPLLLLGAIVAAGWTIWDVATPKVVEAEKGTLAGFTIGESKQQHLI